MARPLRENFFMVFANYHTPEEAKKDTDAAFDREVADYDVAPTCSHCGGKLLEFPGPSTPWPRSCEDCGKGD